MCAGVSIAYQIADVVNAMSQDTINRDSGATVDGGPTLKSVSDGSRSDILNRKVLVPDAENSPGLSCLCSREEDQGYGDEVFTRLKRQEYAPKMCEEIRVKSTMDGKDAVKSVLK